MAIAHKAFHISTTALNESDQRFSIPNIFYVFKLIGLITLSSEFKAGILSCLLFELLIIRFVTSAMITGSVLNSNQRAHILKVPVSLSHILLLS